MRLLKIILVAAWFVTLPMLLRAADAEPTAQPASEAQTSAPAEMTPVTGEPTAHAEHGVSQQAQALFRKHGLITNSMLVTWIVAAVLIIFARIATRKIQAVPSGAQNFWEWLVESLYEFLEGIIGRGTGQKDVLVLCHHFHLHSVHQLVRLDSRGRHNRLGRAG